MPVFQQALKHGFNPSFKPGSNDVGVPTGLKRGFKPGFRTGSKAPKSSVIEEKRRIFIISDYTTIY